MSGIVYGNVTAKKLNQVKEFILEIASLLVGFPPVLLNIGSSAAGSVVIVLVLWIRGDIKGQGGGQVIGRFVVGWLTGSFLGPLFAPAVTAIVKVPDFTVSFVAGGSGYWAMDKYLQKKQDELIKPKAPDQGGDKPL